MDTQVIVHPILGEFYIIKTVGRGTYAKVYQARHAKSNIQVAMKVWSKEAVVDNDNVIKREVDLMKGISHPLIVNLFDSFEYNGKVIYMTELVHGINLLEYANNKGNLNENEARRMFAQMVLIIDYVHNVKHIVHRDLKCENLMVDSYGNIHLIDFGFARAIDDSHPLLSTMCGSPAYVAPEIIKNKPYDAKVDIWSLGVILYAIVNGFLPFDDCNSTKMLAKIVCQEPEFSSELSSDLVDLLKAMLLKDPSERITLEEIKEHPWLTKDSYGRQFTLTSRAFDLTKLYPKNRESIDPLVVQALEFKEDDVKNVLNDFQNGKKTQNTLLYEIVRKIRISNEMASAGQMIFAPKSSNCMPKRVSTFGPQKKTSILPILLSNDQSTTSVKRMANNIQSTSQFPTDQNSQQQQQEQQQQQQQHFFFVINQSNNQPISPSNIFFLIVKRDPSKRLQRDHTKTLSANMLPPSMFNVTAQRGISRPKQVLFRRCSLII
ncbi:CAMK family protein kinase [Tritrichomonas foetus]|uniref:non-specific serine/threonine protein kinase n=1 Tax=Tritrichomonas foetus TaxID=1144522 RepID=A0A1J4J3P3_9EUKA|nr:CAMK family protein kinase [Tritrichomonas foetus]|eukprot:OHS94046.1 CAMK family protein kinase [Tritrichomonas foetus]